ncbi:hypothetical protein VFPFJ_06214 [Purpureocillium lilacinum]|uniref:Secreted protein n=1 Tax=Purpureocillium lilacinum TaxID=33203 RepID=A0A179FP68_PURLI|nr:hypothetical protein VFPFJ_06214 [Purpureocillium lilacinum]OAQ67384.1 hypothetical protein VFPBJ_10979 [Purpureocillium lilacinum]OAQ89800.1 hypothetical protein VFPFJ_06214 [Purpureocillium lilacinum]
MGIWSLIVLLPGAAPSRGRRCARSSALFALLRDECSATLLLRRQASQLALLLRPRGCRRTHPSGRPSCVLVPRGWFAVCAKRTCLSSLALLAAPMHACSGETRPRRCDQSRPVALRPIVGAKCYLGASMKAKSAVDGLSRRPSVIGHWRCSCPAGIAARRPNASQCVAR